MKPHNAFSILTLLLAAGFSATEAASTPLRFSSRPTVQTFPDRAVEWTASVICADPFLLTGVTLAFSFDYNLDGIADESPDSIGLSPANCETGVAGFSRTFFPTGPGILKVEMRQGGVVFDQSSALTGSLGSALFLHRFCARPSNGEPEWIEIRNAAPIRIELNRIEFDGYALKGGLEPGASIIVGRDSAELREWQPAANITTTSTWAYLRNSSDTLRLTAGNGLVLDSLIYSAAAAPREGCASTTTETNVAAASGYSMEIASTRWNPRVGPLSIKVEAPVEGMYDLRVYDLDGFGLCTVAANRKGQAQIQLFAADCPALVNRAGSALFQLRPRNSVPVRKMIRILGQ